MNAKTRIERGTVRKGIVFAIIVIIVDTILLTWNQKIREDKGIGRNDNTINIRRWGMGQRNKINH